MEIKQNAEALNLISNDFIFVSAELAFAFLFGFGDFGVACFYLVNFGFADFVAEKIAFLNDKIAAFSDFDAVVAFEGLVKSETVTCNVARRFPNRFSETPVCVSESVRFLIG